VKTQRSILLVAATPAAARVFQHVVACDPHLRLKLANDSFEALSQAASESADIVIVNAEAPGLSAFDLVRQIREVAGMASAGYALMLSPAASELKISAMGRGIEEFLSEPLDPADLRAALHRMSRVVELGRALHEAFDANAQLDDRIEESIERAARLLTELIETRRPGASDRADRITSLAARLAGRFGIPDSLLPDLTRAARLQELGYLSLSDEESAESSRGSAPEAWRYISVTASVLQHFDGFRGAAEVVRGISEHWDGSGTPDHVLAGQIPLRSRILRLLIDYQRVARPDGSLSPIEALDALSEHSGTRYDPMTLVHFKAVLEVEAGAVSGSRAKVPIPALAEGMVLAEDLCTDAGIKLLSSGTVLSAHALESILRRHRAEPIHGGARVLRSTM